MFARGQTPTYVDYNLHPNHTSNGSQLQRWVDIGCPTPIAIADSIGQRFIQVSDRLPDPGRPRRTTLSVRSTEKEQERSRRVLAAGPESSCYHPFSFTLLFPFPPSYIHRVRCALSDAHRH